MNYVGAFKNLKFIRVPHNGADWDVAETYVPFVSTDQAQAFATANGCELPTPELADAIWKAADVKLLPLLRVHNGDSATMASPRIYADQLRRIEEQLVAKLKADLQKQPVNPEELTALFGRAGAMLNELANAKSLAEASKPAEELTPAETAPDRVLLVAGCFKDVVRLNHGLDIYGWHIAKADRAQFGGMPLSDPMDTTLDAFVIQAPKTSHKGFYEDYSQGARLVRRVPAGQEKA